MKRLLIFSIVCLVLIPIKGYTSLVINEICSNNDTIIRDYYGNDSDWIELKNTSSTAISLRSYCLTDNPDNLHKYRFPSGSTIQPGQIILVWATNDGHTVDPNGEFYTSFALSADGEPVILSLYTTNTIVDQCPAVALDDDISYGRTGTELNWFYFNEPTPRGENTTQVYSAVLSSPIATVNSGWYSDSVSVNFIKPDLGAQIRYTTDGKEPKEDAPIWPGEKYLHNRSSEPNLYSMISTVVPNLLNPNELNIWYPPAITIPKIHTIKVRCFEPGSIPSKTITKTYMVGINLYDLPIVSVSMDPDDLFDDDTGIYIAGSAYDGNYDHANFMQNWERNAYVEWFNSQGNIIFEKQCQVEIHGSYSARAGQKSLRLMPHVTTGDLEFSYPFFGAGYLDHFYQILLRNSGNEVHWTLFRDNLVHSLLKEQGLDTSNFKPYIVFLEGEYWGIHILQENVEEHYVANHYNIPLGSLDVIENNLHALVGDNTDYIALLTFLSTHDKNDPTVWQYLETKIDFDQYCEYLTGELIAGNTDWPGNNMRYWRKRVSYTPAAPYGQDGRYRWLLYDTDYSFGLYQYPCYIHNTIQKALDPALDWRTALLRNLITNTGFRNKLINTIADRLNKTWEQNKVINLINEFQNRYVTSMPMHINRWRFPATYAVWQTNVNNLRTFAANRPATLRGYVVSQFGLAGTANVTLQINPPDAAVIRLNQRVDLTTGSYSYFQGVPISMQAIPSPGWEIVSFGGQQTNSLTISPTAAQTIQLELRSINPPVVTIQRYGNNLLLSWNAISGASSYKVEYKTTPYNGTWSTLQSTTSTHLNLTPTNNKCYYRVKAVY